MPLLGTVARITEDTDKVWVCDPEAFCNDFCSRSGLLSADQTEKHPVEKICLERARAAKESFLKLCAERMCACSADKKGGDFKIVEYPSAMDCSQVKAEMQDVGSENLLDRARRSFIEKVNLAADRVFQEVFRRTLATHLQNSTREYDIDCLFQEIKDVQTDRDAMWIEKNEVEDNLRKVEDLLEKVREEKKKLGIDYALCRSRLRSLPNKVRKQSEAGPSGQE